MRFLPILLGILAASPAWAASPTTVVSSSSLTVQTGTVKETREAPATVQGKDMADIRARATGTVQKILVARGQMVKKGQTLAIVKDTNQAAALAALSAQSQALDERLQLAEKNAARMESLLPTDAASPAEVEQAKAALAGAQAEKLAAETQRRTLQQAVESGVLVAPLTGKVAVMNLVSGGIVMPGDPLITVATMPLRVKVQLPERHATLLTPGDTLTLTGFADGSPREGTVAEVYPSVQNGFATVMVACDNLADTPIGQKLTALVTSGQHPGITLPTSYLRHSNGLTFATLKKDGPVVVQTGAVQPDGTVEVLTGLTAGDVVIKP